MKMAKATERDIDAAGNAMGTLLSISGGYYPSREGEEDTPTFFDPDNHEHLRRFYDLMNETLDAAPGWPGRVIGGMCYVVLYDKNEIVDPKADTLELHPKLAAAPELLAELRRAREYISEHHNSFVEGVTSPKSGLIEDPQDLLFAEANQDLLNGIDAAITKATNQGGI